MNSRIAVGVAGIAFSLLPSLVSAQSVFNQPIVPQSCNRVGGCQSICDIAQLAQNILNLGIFVAVFFSAVLFAWAGWKYMTSGGSGEGVSEARSLITNVIIGLVIILGGWLVVDTIMKTFTNGSFGPWNNVCKTAMTPLGHYYA